VFKIIIKETAVLVITALVINILMYGQTGRTFHTKYKEHIQAIRNNNGNSGYSNHVLNRGHAYLTDTTKVVKIEKKGKHLTH
jgi:hypothetical protein